MSPLGGGGTHFTLRGLPGTLDTPATVLEDPMLQIIMEDPELGSNCLRCLVPPGHLSVYGHGPFMVNTLFIKVSTFCLKVSLCVEDLWVLCSRDPHHRSILLQFRDYLFDAQPSKHAHSRATTSTTTSKS